MYAPSQLLRITLKACFLLVSLLTSLLVQVTAAQVLNAPESVQDMAADYLHGNWDDGPILSLKLGNHEIPRTLNQPWRVPEPGEHADELSFVVERKPNRQEAILVQAQSVSQMQCGKLVLTRWKTGVSVTWPLFATEEGGLSSFALDEALVHAIDVPTFPAYTQDELRRAFNLESGKDGLASSEAVRACMPTIVGYQYGIEIQGKIVQQVFNPGAGQITARGCEHANATLALRVANQLGYLRGKRMHSAICKAWPGQPERSIVALVRQQPGTSQDIIDYDLDVLLVNSKSAEILQHLVQPGAISSDAARFDGIGIDTANYALAPGVRAFGVAIHHEHTGYTSSSTGSLNLYVSQGKTLKPILMYMGTHFSMHSGCYEERHISRNVAIGKTRTKGYADIVVKEKTTEKDGKGTCESPLKHSSRRVVLRFDGEKYPTIPLM